MSEQKIGEKSSLLQCEDCKKFFHYLEGKRWCEECFDKGLHKDMNEHWDNFWKNELGDQPTLNSHPPADDGSDEAF